jgi:hypothetical protein
MWAWAQSRQIKALGKSIDQLAYWTDPDPCAVASRQILEIDRVHNALLDQLKAARGLRAAGKSLNEAIGTGADYVGLARMEAAEQRAYALLEEIAAARQAILETVCQNCPTCPVCVAGTTEVPGGEE